MSQVEQRAQAAQAVCQALTQRTDDDEVINILLTALGVMIRMGDDVHVRCSQLRQFADHLQVDAALRHGPPKQKSTK